MTDAVDQTMSQFTNVLIVTVAIALVVGTLPGVMRSLPCSPQPGS
jgi:hypothetical protein